MSWREQLQHELDAADAAALRRMLRPGHAHGRHIWRPATPGFAHDLPRPLLNLAGNDYLALAQHPDIAAAVASAARHDGVGSGAARLITGHLDLHQQCEARFAAFKHAPAALLLPTGYMANLAALTALAGAPDVILLDKLCHASLIDAARASGATVRVYPHLHTDKLARLLARCRDARRRLIVTDSVFSMDGDMADLPTLCALARAHDALLVVDEAHGTGVLGDDGSGLCALQSVSAAVDVVISTASKALGSLGGIVTGDQLVIDTLVNRARPFIYSTAVPPPQVAAINAALEVVAREPQRRERLQELTTHLRAGLAELGFAVDRELPTPIVPVIVGSAAAALRLSALLEEDGFCVPAVRPPTVAPGSARLRVTLRCDLTFDEIAHFLQALARRWRELQV